MSRFDEKDLLTRGLRERSHDVGGHPIDLDTVKVRARGLRRRRVVGGVVVAVAASIALPAGLVVTGGLGTNPGPDKPPHVASSPSPAPTPRADGTFPLTTKHLPRGERPRLDYVVSGEKKLVTPDGARDLPEAYTQITPYDGGWLAVTGGANGWETLVLDAGMRVVRTIPSAAGDLALNDDGTEVLYAKKDRGRTTVVDASTDGSDVATWISPGNADVNLVGFLDGSRVVFQREAERFAVTMGGAGGTTTPLKGFLHANAASEAAGLVTGMVSYSDATGRACYGAMDPDVSTTRLRWRTCRFEPHAFSPDGRFIVAGAAYSDGPGYPTLTVLDADSGDPVVELTPEKNTPIGVVQASWEDDDTVLATISEGNEVTMVRIEMSGRVEAVTDGYPDPDMSVPLWLADSERW